MAAKGLNRSFVWAELEEEYAWLAARRIAATERGGVLREFSGSAVGLFPARAVPGREGRHSKTHTRYPP